MLWRVLLWLEICLAGATLKIYTARAEEAYRSEDAHCPPWIPCEKQPDVAKNLGGSAVVHEAAPTQAPETIPTSSSTDAVGTYKLVELGGEPTFQAVSPTPTLSVSDPPTPWPSPSTAVDDELDNGETDRVDATSEPLKQSQVIRPRSFILSSQSRPDELRIQTRRSYDPQTGETEICECRRVRLVSGDDDVIVNDLVAEEINIERQHVADVTIPQITKRPTKRPMHTKPSTLRPLNYANDDKIKVIPPNEDEIRMMPFGEVKIEVRPSSEGEIRVRPLDDGKIEVRPSDEGEIRVRPLDEGKIEIRPLDEGKIEVRPLDEGKIEVMPLDESKIEVRPLDGGEIGIRPSEGGEIRVKPLNEDKIEVRPLNEGEIGVIPSSEGEVEVRPFDKGTEAYWDLIPITSTAAPRPGGDVRLEQISLDSNRIRGEAAWAEKHEDELCIMLKQLWRTILGNRLPYGSPLLLDQGSVLPKTDLASVYNTALATIGMGHILPDAVYHKWQSGTKRYHTKWTTSEFPGKVRSLSGTSTSEVIFPGRYKTKRPVSSSSSTTRMPPRGIISEVILPEEYNTNWGTVVSGEVKQMNSKGAIKKVVLPEKYTTKWKAPDEPLKDVPFASKGPIREVVLPEADVQKTSVPLTGIQDERPVQSSTASNTRWVKSIGSKPIVAILRTPASETSWQTQTVIKGAQPLKDHWISVPSGAQSWVPQSPASWEKLSIPQKLPGRNSEYAIISNVVRPPYHKTSWTQTIRKGSKSHWEAIPPTDGYERYWQAVPITASGHERKLAPGQEKELLNIPQQDDYETSVKTEPLAGGGYKTSWKRVPKQPFYAHVWSSEFRPVWSFQNSTGERYRRRMLSSLGPAEKADPGDGDDVVVQRLQEGDDEVKTTQETSEVSPSDQDLFEDTMINGYGCGLPLTVNDRMVDGSPALEGQFPWLVHLSIVPEVPFVCVASLITLRFLLTAAHCILDGDQRTVAIQAIYGNVDQSHAHRVTVSSYKLYPRLSKAANDKHDIALLKLAHRVDVRFARTICLPDGVGQDAGQGLRDVKKELATMASWSVDKVKDGKSSTFLTHANIYILPSAECERSEGLAEVGFESSLQICTLGNGTDTCFGDSGAPIMALRQTDRDSAESNVALEQRGIVPYGFSCASSTPAVATRVEYYINWIIKSLHEWDADPMVGNTGYKTQLVADSKSLNVTAAPAKETPQRSTLTHRAYRADRERRTRSPA
ncbi:serine protease-like [Tropilaelaps mercedesae]|uniref:Serine protease-like n=1 Tax=Tropilaelaps mercedesae TaxID=418985 RepID=A0A1V9X279_9ACAR|nr:serine protease-like [Tropilaelaps mercedesae]